jgi:hypothetical protein
VRKTALLGGASALAAFAVRALRRRKRFGSVSFEESAPPAAGSGEVARVPDPSTADRPPPVEPKPPSEADPSDREVESRLDQETKYDRSREEDEAARGDAAERLRSDPLVERLDVDSDG